MLSSQEDIFLLIQFLLPVQELLSQLHDHHWRDHHLRGSPEPNSR
jgi:hypothetical protein